MVVLLVCLIYIVHIISKEDLSLRDKIFIRLPFSVYFGWISVATIANVTVLLVRWNWDGFGISEAIWAAIIVAVGLIIGAVTAVENRDIAYALVFLWAYAGILIKHTSAGGFSGQYTEVVITVIACIVLLVTALIYIIWSGKRLDKKVEKLALLTFLFICRYSLYKIINYKRGRNMLKMIKKLSFVFLALVLFMMPLVGCSSVNEPIDINFDLNQDAEGWAGGFTDLPVEYEQDIYQLDYGYVDSPLGGKALMLSSMNRSDDIFMFIKKQLTSDDGLNPDTTYLVTIEVKFASNAPAGAVGIGGPPGEAVYVKVGASKIEPSPIDKDGFYELSVDKGQQSSGGYDAVVVGNVAKLVNDDFETYELKTLDNQDNPLEVTTDADGNMWIFAGTDSGFEGLTTLYYTEVNVTIEAK